MAQWLVEVSRDTCECFLIHHDKEGSVFRFLAYSSSAFSQCQIFRSGRIDEGLEVRILKFNSQKSWVDFQCFLKASVLVRVYGPRSPNWASSFNLTCTVFFSTFEEFIWGLSLV